MPQSAIHLGFYGRFASFTEATAIQGRCVLACLDGVAGAPPSTFVTLMDLV